MTLTQTRRALIIFGVLLLSAIASFAQPRTQGRVLTGKVVDEKGEAVIGASILQKGTDNGTVTNLDGTFSLNVPPGTPLVISSIGYKEVEVTAAPGMTVTMMEDVSMLEETVFIGYGTMRKKDLTGSIAQVRAENVEKEAPRSMQDILRGGVAGLTISMATGVEGTADVQVRGKNTLTAGSSPLYVVDGVIYPGEMSNINPNDIESIDVLKDASSVAIYGAKAASGVIAITTKRGKNNDGRPTIGFNANVGIARAANRTPLLDGEGFIKMRQDYMYSLLKDSEIAAQPGIYDDPRTLSGVDPLTWYNYGQKEPATSLPGQDALVSRWLQRLAFSETEIGNYLSRVETDWDDYFFPYALQQDYTVSMSNKTANNSYYASVGYLDRQSYIAYGGFRSIRGRINLESNVAKWLTVGVNSNFIARDDSRLQGDTDYRDRLSPWTTNLIDEPDNILARWPNGDSLIHNPWWDNKYTDRSDKRWEMAFNLYGIIHLPWGFEFQSNFSPRLKWHEYFNHQSSQNPNWGSAAANSERTNERWYNWQIDNILRWKQTFGDHRIELTLGQNAEQNQYWKTLATNKNYSPSDVLGYHYLNAGLDPKAESEDWFETGDALFARLFYSLKNRYMLTLSVRRDGFSAFGVENPRGIFPSAAFAWVFSEEPWLRNANDWLTYGKLRVSYGVNGNRDIGRYQALARLKAGPYEYIDPSTGAAYQTSQMFVEFLGNSHLKWERTTAFNVGLDYTLFGGCVDGSIDYYDNTTNDLLVDRKLPRITGFSSITSNLGEIKNHGFEFLANFHPVRNENFQWNTTVTFYFNRRKLTHLYGDMVDVLDDNGNVIGQREADDTENDWYIGHDPNEIYDYQWAGVWQVDEAEEAQKFGNKPGDFKYVNQNDDTTLNLSDKVFTGKYTTPRYQLSWRNDFNFFKNFSAGFMMYAKLGQWGTYNRAANAGSNLDRYNWYDIPRWTADNPINDYARIGSVNKGNHYVNKSFVRMESIYLSYDLPKSFLRTISVQSARLSLSVRNPFVITKWEFGDVEGGDYTPQSFSVGINVTL